MKPQVAQFRPGSDRVSDRADIDCRVRDLVRCILYGAAGNEPPLLDPAQELILDAEIDGMRYRLFRKAAQQPHPETLLSPRELEIGRMVAKGYPNKVIAGVLEISSWTVGTHLRRIFAKLGVSSRAAMVARIVGEYLPIASSRALESKNQSRSA
jgi:DNA-binding NarL/FixJ family response regulator